MSPGSLPRRAHGGGMAYRVAAKKFRTGRNGYDVKAAMPAFSDRPEGVPMKGGKPPFVQVITR